MTWFEKTVRCASLMGAMLSAVSLAPLFLGAQTREWPTTGPARFADLTYPAQALAQGLSGVVVIRVTTDTGGRVTDATALRGPEPLAAAAVDNARTWTLSPESSGGVVVYRFEIDPGRCLDDSRSLFRLVQPNLAVVTACSGPDRPNPTWPDDGAEFVTMGERPHYPAIAQSARMGAIVVLELHVQPDGRIQPEPLTKLPIFTDAAVSHARQWRVRAGKTHRTTVVYEFLLDNHVCEPETTTAFRAVLPGYWRLSGCAPTINP